MLAYLVKTNEKQTLRLCDFHIAQLGAPVKKVGPTDFCSVCAIATLASPHSNLETLVVWIVSYFLDVNRGCKVLCDDCINIWTETYSATITNKRHAPKSYDCTLCKRNSSTT